MNLGDDIVAAQGARAQVSKNKPKILIVEDDENIRETLSTILQKKGYSTDTAKNGKEAIKKSKAKFFNLTLLDIKLQT